MPIDINKLAKTTGFGNNCVLHALAHKIMSSRYTIANHDDEGGRGAFGEMCNEFNDYYGLTGGANQIDNAGMLRLLGSLENNPIRLEVVLGPVLRKMVQSEQEALGLPIVGNLENLGADHIIPLANRFGLNVESYEKANPNVDGLGNLGKIDDCVDILRLYNTGGHWEFQEYDVRLKNHNTFYDDKIRHNPAGFQYNSGFHFDKLKNGLKLELAKPAPDLNTFFDQFEQSESGPKPTPAPTPSFSAGAQPPVFDMIDQAVAKIAEMFSGEGRKGSLLAFIPALFGGIAKFLFGAMTFFKEIGKIFNPGQDLDKEDKEKDPAASYFSKYVKMLPENVRGDLNEAWRTNPNSEEVWIDLMRTLHENGLYDQADELLKEREQNLLNLCKDFENEHFYYKDEEDQHEYTDAYSAQLKVLEQDSELSNPNVAVSSEYRNRNFSTRLNLFQHYYHVAHCEHAKLSFLREGQGIKQQLKQTPNADLTQRLQNIEKQIRKNELGAERSAKAGFELYNQHLPYMKFEKQRIVSDAAKAAQQAAEEEIRRKHQEDADKIAAGAPDIR